MSMSYFISQAKFRIWISVLFFVHFSGQSCFVGKFYTYIKCYLRSDLNTLCVSMCISPPFLLLKSEHKFHANTKTFCLACFLKRSHILHLLVYIDRNIGIEREPSAKQKTRNRYNKWRRNIKKIVMFRSN